MRSDEHMPGSSAYCTGLLHTGRQVARGPMPGGGLAAASTHSFVRSAVKTGARPVPVAGTAASALHHSSSLELSSSLLQFRVLHSRVWGRLRRQFPNSGKWRPHERVCASALNSSSAGQGCMHTQVRTCPPNKLTGAAAACAHSSKEGGPLLQAPASRPLRGWSGHCGERGGGCWSCRS